MAYNLLFTVQMEKSVLTTTAVSIIDFTILKKGLSNIIKAKINYYNKTEITKNLKYSYEMREKYSIYTPKYITKYKRISRIPLPKKSHRDKRNQNLKDEK